jgi:hypothetical protein
MRPTHFRTALVAYGCINAILYASILPLWEGFDEPFHYGYIQELSQHHKLPQLGKTLLSRDICQSLELTPASHVVKRNLPWVTTFGDYFHLSAEERTRLRSRLSSLPADPAAGTCAVNYEAHQAPLAYLLLAVPDALLQPANLLVRVWVLRWLCAILSCLATVAGLFLLTRRLHLPDSAADTVVFIVLSSQMFYATTAHIANDWLAVPLMVLFFERTIALWDDSTYRNALLLSITLSAGLLTKAYFLAVAPLAIGAVAVAVARHRLSARASLVFGSTLLVLAAPWYVRNFRLYRNLSGMQETNGGGTLFKLLEASLQVPWMRAAKEIAYNSLWSGNNSFVTFSRTSLTALLAGFLAAAACCLWQLRDRRSERERLLLYGCLLYAAALIYSTVVSFWASGGEAFTASPWYAQPIFPIVTALLFCGLVRIRLGGIIAIWLVGWSAYILCATYWAKLIPLYAGYGQGRSTLSQLTRWYITDFHDIITLLSVTAIRSAGLVLGLSAIAVLLGISLSLKLCERLARCVSGNWNHREHDNASVKIRLHV